MTVEVTPPEGKTSFTGIPESQFIDDVDSYMKGEDNAEAKIKSFDEVGNDISNHGIDINHLFSGSSKIQIHGEQSGYTQEEAEGSGS